MAYETAVVGGFVGILFLWAYLAFNIGGNKNNNQESEVNFEGLKLLLILMVFLGIGIALFIMRLIAVQNLASVANIIDSAYKGYLVVFTFITGYYIFMFIMWLFNKMMEKKPR